MLRFAATFVTGLHRWWSDDELMANRIVVVDHEADARARMHHELPDGERAVRDVDVDGDITGPERGGRRRVRWESVADGHHPRSDSDGHRDDDEPDHDVRRRPPAVHPASRKMAAAALSTPSAIGQRATWFLPPMVTGRASPVSTSGGVTFALFDTARS